MSERRMTYAELTAFVDREVKTRNCQWSLSFEVNHWQEPDFDFAGEMMKTVTDGTMREVKARINQREVVIQIDHDTQDYAPVAEWIRQQMGVKADE